MHAVFSLGASWFALPEGVSFILLSQFTGEVQGLNGGSGRGLENWPKLQGQKIMRPEHRHTSVCK